MLILYNELNLLHKLTKDHPERPQRIQQTIKYLRETQFGKFILQSAQIQEQLKFKQNDINKIVENQIIKTHGQKYFDFIEGMWCEGLSKPQMYINIDTYYGKNTFLAAFEAVKTSILAVQQNLSNQSQDIVCLIRPPGHHSGNQNQPHGFCFFNNVAIAADYFVEKTKQKVVIIDWDIHHGEGTQKLFYNRKDVFYISLHRYDNGSFFPHYNLSSNKCFGQGQGLGYNINICWNFPKIKKGQIRKENQSTRDQEYLYCFQKIIIPILQKYEFKAIFISCGFDCAEGDPIGESKVTKNCFRQMSNLLKQLHKQLFFVLQGGYNIDTVKFGVQSVLEGISNKSIQQIPQIKIENLNQFARNDIQSSLQGIRNYWKL